jgi:hypothetical protein
MSSDKIHIGSYRLQAAGNAEFNSTGDYFTVFAAGLDGMLSLRAMSTVVAAAGCAMLTLENSTPVGGNCALQGGIAGTVKLGAGLPLVGALVTVEPEQITLSVGPPGVGASIKMTPVSITFQVAETSYEMTPLGIVEKMAATQRELTPLGHAFTAAETEASIAVEGVSYSAPLVQTTVEAMTEATETLGSYATDAMKQEEIGMAMLE